MSIFDLHSSVLTDYRDFVLSFFTVADERAREFVERALVEEARLWPEFLLQVSPSYARTATVESAALASARWSWADLPAASASAIAASRTNTAVTETLLSSGYSFILSHYYVHTHLRMGACRLCQQG